MFKKITAMSVLCAVVASQNCLADGTTRADSHAPIGVMADHFHKKGEWMISYRFMTMSMEGNLVGSNSIAADAIATTIPNRFFGLPNQPPTLRVVPVNMDMDMHMFGVMYAPMDRLTLMAMTSYTRKEMDHITYAGGTGTAVLGTFTTESSGIGDTSLTGLISLHNSSAHKIHALLGISFPTGSTDETGVVLTPMNTQPTLRLPYPMQSGSGSFDPIIGASYSGFGDSFAWGGQWLSTYRVEDNDEGYQLGNEHRLTGWISYLFSNPWSASLRLEYYKRENIDGIDPNIIAPVQTADPGRQGISRTDLGFGLNWAGQGSLFGYRLALEYSVPIGQDLDGPQLETDSQLMLGFQKSFY